MMRGTFTVLSFISTVFFPWPLTIIFVLCASFFEPLVPLAIGIFADALYYAAFSGALPMFALYGALATALAFFVRSRLKASIIWR